MRKVFKFGKVVYTGKSKSYAVEVEMELDYKENDRPVFTASANVWNTIHTDIVMGGQCLDDIWTEFREQLNNPSLFKKILDLWHRNHLNNMNAGCEHQRKEQENGRYAYTDPCPICGYKYGTKWVYKPISVEDLSAIQALLGEGCSDV